MGETWPLHTLVFDLDDTLYPERDYVLGGFAAVDEWLRRTRALAGFGGRCERLFAAGVRGRIFDEALAESGGPPGLTVADLVEVYRAHVPRLRMPAESVELLEWARARFRLALVSDGYLEVQRRKVEALGLARWIQVIVLSDELGRACWKPSPRPFEEVARRLPGAAAGFAYVGDNPGKDFIGPRTIGWRTIRLRREGGEHAGVEAMAGAGADREISRLADLPRLVRPWAAA